MFMSGKAIKWFDDVDDRVSSSEVGIDEEVPDGREDSDWGIC